MITYAATLGDVLQWSEEYDGPPFHALLSDAPYHLTTITRRFGKADAAPAQFGSDGAFQRASRGFMGKTWDGGDVAFRPETWAAITRHMLPGAFGMVFGGARTYHRMAVAMEDAGLIIHPMVFCWSYGSGFPKATKPADQYIAGKLRAWLAANPAALDELRAAQQAVRDAEQGQRGEARTAYQRLKQELQERAGLTRVVGQRRHAPKFDAAGHGYREKDNGFNSKEHDTFDVVEYLDPLAAAWAGHRYGLQALKPAVEPAIVFQVPYGDRPIDDIIGTGAGALWIDGGRVEGEVPQTVQGASAHLYGNGHGLAPEGYQMSQPHEGGRWPANLALVHHPRCNGHCHPECNVARMAAQSGELKSGTGAVKRATSDGHRGTVYGAESRPEGTLMASYGDEGAADRFFFDADWMYERLELADQVGYFAKASQAEREAGLDPLQIALVRELYGLDEEEFDETAVDDGRAVSIDNPYQRGETDRRNTHPTIKPISLTRWLATLLLPPAHYAPGRRLLVPFAGAGSEMIGAMLAGWDQLVGVELDADHVRIAEARLAYWHQQRHRFAGDRPIKLKIPRAKGKKGKKGAGLTMPMFGGEAA